jgi:hypothetical protein
MRRAPFVSASPCPSVSPSLRRSVTPSLRPPLPLRGLLLAFALAFTLALTPARATSVIPPTFPELVDEADAIYRARVTAVAARRVPAPDGTPVIKTFVTFAIERTLKGPDRPDLTLEFLGGTVDGETLVVSGMPRFSAGSVDYVFVQRNGLQFCPLVAVMHGRYRIKRDDAAASTYVARDNGTPLTDLAQISLPLTALPAALSAATAPAARRAAFTPAAFESAVTGEVQRQLTRARLQ